VGVQKIFAQISPNSPEKSLGHFLCEYFLMKAVFEMTSKKRASCDFGRHFFQIKARCAQFLPKFSGILQRFLQISTDFHQIPCLLRHWFSVLVISASYLPGHVSIHAARYDSILIAVSTDTANV